MDKEILKYLKDNKIIVIKNAEISGFCVSPKGPTIFLEKELTKDEKIIILLHELGHFLQFKKIPYWDTLLIKLRKENKLVEHEEDAWEKAEKLLKYFGLEKINKLKKLMKQIKKQALKKYKEFAKHKKQKLISLKN
jgi:hypothetical protein